MVSIPLSSICIPVTTLTAAGTKNSLSSLFETVVTVTFANSSKDISSSPVGAGAACCAHPHATHESQHANIRR